MPKLSDADLLLQHLPPGGASIGNLKLRRQLGWGEKRYATARDALVGQGRLATGRGSGGSVRLDKPAASKALRPKATKKAARRQTMKKAPLPKDELSIIQSDAGLAADVRRMIEQTREGVARTVNAGMTLLYERTAISKKPEEVAKAELAALRADDRLTPDLVFRDPYVVDFLGLKDRYLEKDIEDSILRELETFLLELGNGFAYLGRQTRIADTLLGWKEEGKLSRIIDHSELEKNDYNISPSRYIRTSDAETSRPISEIAEELWGKGGLEEQSRETDEVLKDILKQIGITA